MRDTEDQDREPVTAPPEVSALNDGGPAKRPVLIILHQPHSVPGHIGRTLALQGHQLDIRRPRFGDPLPTTMAEHDGAVIFGGPMSANDTDDFIRAETDWIGVCLKEKAPFLGVCLGAQMLARHLGSKVWLHDAGHVEIGYHEMEPVAQIYDEGPWPTRFYQWHKEGFDLPSGCQLVAKRPGAFPNQAMRYGETAVGIQFHPEITYAMVCRWSGHNPHRLTATGAQPRNDQMRDHIAHGPLVRRWLDRVLRSWVLAGRRARNEL